MAGELTHTASKEKNGTMCPIIPVFIQKVKYPLSSIVSYPIKNQNCSKATSAVKVAIIKSISVTKGSYHVCLPNLLATKDEWETKEDTGKPMNKYCGMTLGVSCNNKQ